MECLVIITVTYASLISQHVSQFIIILIKFIFSTRVETPQGQERVSVLITNIFQASVTYSGDWINTC